MALGLDFFGDLFSGGDIGASLINDISGHDPSAIFGSKPKVADYTPVDLAAESAKALSTNLANLPSINELLNKVIPGFSDFLSTGLANAQAFQLGKLPQADLDALHRDSAFQSLQGGYGGTPMADANDVRNYGRRLVDLNLQGANLGQQMTQLAEGAYSPFAISTGQQASTTAANNAGLQAQQQFQFNVNAAPDPSVLGHFQLDQHIGDQFMSFGLGAAGGAIAGGGGSGAPSYGQPTGYNYPAPGYNLPPNYNSGYGSTDWRTNATWGGGG